MTQADHVTVTQADHVTVTQEDHVTATCEERTHEFTCVLKDSECQLCSLV